MFKKVISNILSLVVVAFGGSKHNITAELLTNLVSFFFAQEKVNTAILYIYLFLLKVEEFDTFLTR